MAGNLALHGRVTNAMDWSTDVLRCRAVVTRIRYQEPTDGLSQSFSFRPANARYVRVDAIGLRKDTRGNHGMALTETWIYK